MKTQSALLLVILFALVVAVFAVINVDPVKVNYVFGQSEWPLILVIIVSVLMGGLISGLLSLFRTLGLKRQNNVLIHQIEKLKEELHDLKAERRRNTPADQVKRIAPDGQ
ncbi:lipopolysaccharide assembly protein LapA domain-containing protein [Bacillus badius]|uniref:LapA family protein n=1 Tax=Bacillus badius TaxID=1455 RepID=UPI002E1BDA97|nr:lipopolysaccharide assembly protein LapA domain-containing protein [Bacillus badius]MED0666290.1 lipopolysaccharide assembly protein LapA domain-containing protein [Bacillus badius]